MGLAVAFGTMTAPALARRTGTTPAIAGGLVVSALGAALLTRVDSSGSPLTAIVAVAVLALGTGPLFALGTGLVVGSVPPQRAGSAAAMSETGNYFGGSLGVALIGVISASVFHSRMAGALPAGAPAAAGRTLAGATAAGDRLPPARAAELLHTAKAAFTAGVHLTGVIATVIFCALAVLVVMMRPGRDAGVTPAELPAREPAKA